MQFFCHKYIYFLVQIRSLRSRMDEIDSCGYQIHGFDVHNTPKKRYCGTMGLQYDISLYCCGLAFLERKSWPIVRKQ